MWWLPGVQYNMKLCCNLLCCSMKCTGIRYSGKNQWNVLNDDDDDCFTFQSVRYNEVWVFTVSEMKYSSTMMIVFRNTANGHVVVAVNVANLHLRLSCSKEPHEMK